MSATRVARVITRLNIGGPSLQALSLSRDLTPKGFDTLLIHGQLAEGEGDMTAIVSLDGVGARYVRHLTRPISPFRDLRALWALYRAFCAWRPEIVHTHMAKAGALGRLAAVAYNWTVGARRPARLVHTYHGHVFEGYFGPPSTRAFLAVERWLGRRTDALIAISPQVRHDVLRTYRIGAADRVRLIALGFNLDQLAAISDADRARARTDLAIEPGELVVTTVGRLTAIKQHWLFVEMARRLAASDARLLFLVVGDGELRPSLEEQARAHGLTSRVRFLGWRGDLQRIYGGTDVFVLTSRNEGTPVALIEAMASSVASVSTRVGGVVDVITGPDVGLLVPFGDPDALADAVRSLLARDARDRRAMGEAARRAVLERFALRRLVADVSGLYRELLRDRYGTVEDTAHASA